MTPAGLKCWEGAPVLPDPGMEPHQVARLLVGSKFLHMGRSWRAVDCVGLGVLVAHGLGLPVEDSPYYGREPARNNNSFQLADYLARNLGPPVDRPYQVNDLVLMKLRPRFDPAHVGIIAPHRYGFGLIHSYAEVDHVVEHRIDAHWHDKIVGVYEWPAKH
jgi:hypothetical protein